MSVKILKFTHVASEHKPSSFFFLTKKAWFHQICLIDIYPEMDPISTQKIAKFSSSCAHACRSYQQLLPPEPIFNPEKTLGTVIGSESMAYLSIFDSVVFLLLYTINILIIVAASVNAPPPIEPLVMVH